MHTRLHGSQRERYVDLFGDTHPTTLRHIRDRRIHIHQLAEDEVYYDLYYDNNSTYPNEPDLQRDGGGEGEGEEDK